MDLSGSADSVLLEGFRLDRRGGCLFRVDQGGVATPVALGSRATALLERRGELVSKDAIMEAAWPGRVIEEANLNVQIARLRQILDRDRKNGSCIRTIAGLSIVVLPFTNLSDDREQQHFAEGNLFGLNSRMKRGATADSDRVRQLTFKDTRPQPVQCLKPCRRGFPRQGTYV
jgi:Transcriptional regulatory protein, C terminal